MPSDSDKNLFLVTNAFNDCISRYLSREAAKGKDTWKTLERIMRMWVSFAASKVKRGNRPDIYDYYTSKFRVSKSIKRKKRSALFMDFRESYALLQILKYNKALRLASPGDKLYTEARKYTRKKQYAVGLHRGGFKPAFKKLGPPIKGANLGAVPKYNKFTTGDIKFEPTGKPVNADEFSIIVTNYAKVIEEIAPNAFNYSMSEVSSLFNRYMYEDMVKANIESGFYTP